jgi:hypothetical protein
MKPGEVRVVASKKPHDEIIDPDLVFPGCRQMPSRSGLPVARNGSLRHTFKALQVEVGPFEMLSHFLVGHALESAKYIAELIIENGPALREAQEKISARVFEIARAQTWRPPRCAARAGRAELGPFDPEKEQRRHSGSHRLRRAGEGAGAR